MPIRQKNLKIRWEAPILEDQEISDQFNSNNFVLKWYEKILKDKIWKLRCKRWKWRRKSEVFSAKKWGEFLKRPKDFAQAKWAKGVVTILILNV